MKEEPVLLITGAIDIQRNRVPLTRITDTQTRLEQYIQSICYAIKKYRSINKIVFVENTNFLYDYKALYSLAINYRKTLEVLSFQGNIEKTVIHGKGYGEIECINYALEKSALLRSAETFIKLTGRVRVMNFDCVLHSAYGDNSFYAISTASFPYIETIFYLTGKKFFKENLHDIGNLVFDREKMYLERILYLRLNELSKDYPVGSFKIYRFLEGISASTGNTYATSLKHKISNSIYAAYRKFDINRQ